MAVSANVVRVDPPQRRRTQEERTAETKSALIEATIALLCEAGYGHTTTIEIVRRAGCTTGAMQHHFGSKEELFVDVLDRLFEEFKATYAAFPRSEMSVAERCRFIIDALWKLYGAPRYMAIWELHIGARSEPGLHALIMRHRADSVATCERAWLKSFEDSPLGDNRHSDLLRFVLAALRSFGLQNAFEGDKAFFQRQLKLLEKFVESEIGAVSAPKLRRIRRSSATTN